MNKCACVDVEDPAFEGDDIEVNSEDEYAVVYVFLFLVFEIF